jgi:predicted nucleotidyltransferase
MNRFDLMRLSEDYIRDTLRRYLRSDAAVYLYGSRARGDAAWNSDYDLWIDGELPRHQINAIVEDLDESFVPFHVDLVTTGMLRGAFGERVRAEAKRWM